MENLKKDKKKLLKFEYYLKNIKIIFSLILKK
jgi:hypothetical protein